MKKGIGLTKQLWATQSSRIAGEKWYNQEYRDHIKYKDMV